MDSWTLCIIGSCTLLPYIHLTLVRISFPLQVPALPDTQLAILNSIRTSNHLNSPNVLFVHVNLLITMYISGIYTRKGPATCEGCDFNYSSQVAGSVYPIRAVVIA